jgi:hypothetical protein
MITNAEEFVALRESSSQDEYLRAARETAPVAVWRDVIARFPHMRKWVAVNKTVPVEILEILAKDDDADVRVFVAMKNSLPLHLMVLLSRDQAEGVRQRIACNKRAPVDVLKGLCSDPCDLVSAAALERMRGKVEENE